ncbi:MAG: diguanylate cyclase [Hyphomicrobiales bacterium]|nr:diguanylate cyclase [Hyphomicrobiales bacterium]
MFQLLTCLAVDHDYRVLGLAVLICIVGAWVSLRLFQNAIDDEPNRLPWLFLAGAAAGSTVWATHFLSMLAYSPSASLGYEPETTFLSWIVAVAACCTGLFIALFRRMPGAPEAGGAFIGLGIGAMHYLGMSALRGADTVIWDPQSGLMALGLSAIASALSLSLASRSRHEWAPGISVAAFVSAVCGLHFIAMTSVEIDAASGVHGHAPATNSNIIAAGVFVATLMIIGAGAAARLIVLAESALARKRVLALADAAIEGILIWEAGRIVAVNRSFEMMSGYDLKSLSGMSIFPDLIAETSLDGGASAPAQVALNTIDGCWIPVELTSSVADDGQIIYAMRDLRARIASLERIDYLAHFDTLTNLPNRQTSIDHLERALLAAGPSDKAAVIAMDLDHFKQVNDLFGHAAGDQVLVQVTKAMRAVLQDGEYLARTGGDKFVAILTNGDQPQSARDFCERMIAAVTKPVALLSGAVDIGISIGVAIYPLDGQASSELMANAEFAVYRAKKIPESSVCYFVPEMDESMKLRRALAHDLRDASTRNELELYYQVQTSILDSKIVGYEALLRWNHPRLGLVSPDDFIPIAEESGLITAIGTWVLERACEDAANWPIPYRVAVNVSGVQISTGDLPATVLRILMRTGLPASRLELEITETVLIANTERTLLILRQLRALGVSIAMDDFGTGYSSLSSLEAFPFDKIKIDRSFIKRLSTQPQSRSIVRAILALGRGLEIPVLAEGIEIMGDLMFLRDEGCDEAQGYLLGRPLPLAMIEELSGEAVAQKACA